MKNLTKLTAVIAILLLFAACGSSKKGCGFTAKSDLIDIQNDTNFSLCINLA